MQYMRVLPVDFNDQYPFNTNLVTCEMIVCAQSFPFLLAILHGFTPRPCSSSAHCFA
jgi:hypothetical protein